MDGAIRICRAEEAAKQTEEGISSPLGVYIVKSTYKRQKSQSKAVASPQKTDHAPSKCPNCGRRAHTTSACPAAGKRCNGCKLEGHFQSLCPQQRSTKKASTKRVGQLQLNMTPAWKTPTVPVATTLATEDQPVSLDWIPDTGSDVDAVGVSQITALGGFVENLDVDDDDVRGANGTQLRSLGKICATFSTGATQHVSTIHAYEGLDDALLSRATLQELGFLPQGWPRKSYRVSNPAASPDPTPNEIDEVRRQLMEEFADVFADSPLKPMKGPPMDIDLRPDAVPSRVHAPRAIPYAYRDQVKTQRDGMVAEGIIKSVTEPSDWCHPVVIVAKKGTDEKRLTVDFKKIERPSPTTSTPDAHTS